MCYCNLRRARIAGGTCSGTTRLEGRGSADPYAIAHRRVRPIRGAVAIAAVGCTALCFSLVICFTLNLERTLSRSSLHFEACACIVQRIRAACTAPCSRQGRLYFCYWNTEPARIASVCFGPACKRLAKRGDKTSAFHIIRERAFD